MEFAVKRFARNILLLHVGLLVVVLVLLLFASRAIRNGAREQAKHQAESRQRMLAGQTARGIEAFYDTIVSDMNLRSREDDTDLERSITGSMLKELTRDFSFPIGSPATQSSTQPAGERRASPAFPTSQPANSSQQPNSPKPGPFTQGQSPQPGANPNRPQGNQPGNRMANAMGTPRPKLGRGFLFGQLLGKQLRERVTHLFVVAHPSEPPPGKNKPAVANPGKLVVREQSVKPKESDGVPTAEALVERFHDWLLTVKEPAISKFELFDGKGFNLVAMQVNNGQAILVAAVPVSNIAEQFLAAISSDPTTGVMLVNDSLTVMAASRTQLAGVSAATSGDLDFKQSLEFFKNGSYKGTATVEHPFEIAGEMFEPSLLTAEPIDVAGRKWFLVVGSPLQEVDAVVAQLFSKIFVWAIVVVVLITGILISTAVQMIRGRLRLEAVRHETMRKELERARQIQQAWLPRTAPACSSIDVAAANFPANHISGDFYNWFELHDGRTAIVIGDVTGHGMSAAFLMATTQLLVRTTMQRIVDPAACLEEVNRQLCTLVFNEQFVTLQIIIIDPAGGPLEVASAGHPAPLLADHGRFVPLESTSGLVLGVDPDVRFETSMVELPAGASLLLYTDGATDVIAPNGKRLGNDGLRAACPAKLTDRLAKCGDAKTMLDAVVNSINHFRGSRELADDLTFVAIRMVEKARSKSKEFVGAA